MTSAADLILPQLTGLRNWRQSHPTHSPTTMIPENGITLDTILEGILHTFVYIDDILVASSSPEEHLADLTRVFDVLKENELVVNRSKCVLGVPALDFLGYRVDAKGARPLEERVTAIRQFASPTTVKELQRFLGMINCYR